VKVDAAAMTPSPPRSLRFSHARHSEIARGARPAREETPSAPGYRSSHRAPRSAFQEEIDMVKVGDVAPSFKAKNHKGQEVELGKLKGKTVVLWFYPRADTPG